jgi:hypothetical protein
LQDVKSRRKREGKITRVIEQTKWRLLCRARQLQLDWIKQHSD